MLIAFLTGLLGSLHCLGMCGPLALALPVGKGRGPAWGLGSSFFRGRMLYNIGRVVTYSILGGAVAMLGVAAAMFDVQRYFSLALGGLMLVLAVRELGWLGGHKGSKLMARPGRWLTGQLAKRMQKRGPMALFAFGLLNGLLPCGMVYVGLFQAALAETPVEGMMRMALFGLGTWPVMVTVSISGQWLLKVLGGRFRVMPVLMAGVGLMLLLRGMALGIPYLSPQMQRSASGVLQMACDPAGLRMSYDARIEAVSEGEHIPVCD